MYVKIEPHDYNLIDLLFVMKSSSEIYLSNDEGQRNHRKAYYLLNIIQDNDKHSFAGLISDEITSLSEEAIKRPHENQDIIGLINILSSYLYLVRSSFTLPEMFCEGEGSYVTVKKYNFSDYVISEENESDDIPLLDLEEEKDFFQESDESDDFDFGDNEEPPEIYERPSEVDEADIIRNPKSI